MDERTSVSPSSDTTTLLPSSGDKVLRFLDDHIWVPILCGLVFIGIIIVVIYCYRRLTTRARYDYSALHEELARPQKLHLERKRDKEEVRDFALLNCSFYLRSSGKYSLVDQLPEIGSRISKQWFMVRDVENQNMVMSMVKKSSNMSISFNKTNKLLLQQFFSLLQHPYIFPTTEVDFIITQESIVVVQPFNVKGSLKDVIYGSECMDSWQSKYCFKSKGLPVPTIQLYGRQILEALLYLEEYNLPPFTQLHNGNVMVEDNICRLTGYEMTLLGFPSKLHPLIRRKLRIHPEAAEQIAFGHMIFEMAAGFELDCAQPQPRHYHILPQKNIREVLEFIFHHEQGSYPSLRQIANHQFFSGVLLNENLQLINKDPFPGPIQSMFKQIRKRNKTLKRMKPRESRNPRLSSPLINMQSDPKYYGSVGSLSTTGSLDSMNSLTHNPIPPLLPQQPVHQNSSPLDPMTSLIPDITAHPKSSLKQGKTPNHIPPLIPQKPQSKSKSSKSPPGFGVTGAPPPPPPPQGLVLGSGKKPPARVEMEDKRSALPEVKDERSALLAEIKRGMNLRRTHIDGK